MVDFASIFIATSTVSPTPGIPAHTGTDNGTYLLLIDVVSHTWPCHFVCDNTLKIKA